jgi:hypothetical protein
MLSSLYQNWLYIIYACSVNEFLASNVQVKKPILVDKDHFV